MAPRQDGVVDLAGDVSLYATHDFGFGPAFADAAAEVVESGLVAAHPYDADDVQGAVGVFAMSWDQCDLILPGGWDHLDCQLWDHRRVASVVLSFARSIVVTFRVTKERRAWLFGRSV